MPVYYVNEFGGTTTTFTPIVVVPPSSGSGGGTTTSAPISNGTITTSTGISVPVVNISGTNFSNPLTITKKVTPHTAQVAKKNNNIETFTGSNATVRLIVDVDALGTPTWRTYNLGITSINTNSTIQYSSAQVHNGIVRMPVRRSEQMVQFTVDWPLQIRTGSGKGYDYNGFRLMNQFHNDLKKHLQYTINSYRPAPMEFSYTNNSDAANKNPIVDNNLKGLYGLKTGWKNDTLESMFYQGWVLTVPKEYDRFKNVYTQQYVMNILTPYTSRGDTTFWNSGTSGTFDTSINSGDQGKTMGDIIRQKAVISTDDLVKRGLDWAGSVSEPQMGINVQEIPN
jgi:hypothetical protein